MKLTFKQAFQSITSFTDTEVNDFLIITGLNGSGKTHLLRAISTGHIEVKDIDPSEIIFYNYNDFTIHNSDPSQDLQIQEKHLNFQNKSNQISQKLNTERNNVLNSYSLNLSLGSLNLSEYFFQDVPDLESLLDWTEEDYDIYLSHQKNSDDIMHSDNYSQLKHHQRQLFEYLGQPQQNDDIRGFIQTLRDFKSKADALQMIRALGYNEQIIEWEAEELKTLFAGLESAGNRSAFFDSLIMDNTHVHNPWLSSYLQQFFNLYRLPNNITFERCLEMRSHIELIFQDIKEHFKRSMNPHSLKILGNLNGDLLLKHISPDSGFLNLFEIKQAEKQYQIQKKQAEYTDFAQYKEGIAKSLMETDYVKLYGKSPVDMLNKVLTEYDCNGYEFRQSQLSDDFVNGLHHQQIEISLYNKTGNYSTTLDALSSGERTLLALAFTISKLSQRRVIAKLFLMDEIDSALHPSMSKRLLQVLHTLFYKEMGINIIISTHSPSTIAFAPEGSTYVMRRDELPRLIATTKDAALNALTAGVPSFSVNYENRRQVFVESKYDAEYYEDLYDIFKDHLDPEVSLNFISSGDSENNKNGIGKSNCDQVIKITGILRAAGNKFIWGIIDWDLTNEPLDGVRILGHKQRYNIESYLLDPLLIGILLWRDKMEEATFFNQTEDTKYFEVSSFDAAQTQLIINAVLVKLKVSIGPAVGEGDQEYETINGLKLTLPIWYSTYPGHKLEEHYLKAFPKLNEIKRDKEAALKLHVIRKIISDFSGLAPLDLIGILRQVQQA